MLLHKWKDESFATGYSSRSSLVLKRDHCKDQHNDTEKERQAENYWISIFNARMTRQKVPRQMPHRLCMYMFRPMSQLAYPSIPETKFERVPSPPSALAYDLCTSEEHANAEERWGQPRHQYHKRKMSREPYVEDSWHLITDSSNHYAGLPPPRSTFNLHGGHLATIVSPN